MNWIDSKKGLFILGCLVGVGALFLAMNGNPGNMAICTACFIRDIAGAIKLQQVPTVQYFRPEIVGIVIGAFVMAIFRGELRATGGSSTVIRFFVGMIMMICALVFLGCPLRMMLRMSSGEIGAYVGLVGFATGILSGTFFLKKGYSLEKEQPMKQGNSFIWPLVLVGAFLLFLAVPSLFASSAKGPGSMHAPIFLSLAVGALLGAVAQLSRLCFSGAIRNVFLMKDFRLLSLLLGFFLVMVIYNVAVGSFAVKAFGPIAHGAMVWNFLAMFAVGLGAILISGCPLRQLVLASTGNIDSVITVLGMIFGAAIAHNFLLAAAPGTPAVLGGPNFYGQVAVIFSILCLLVLGWYGMSKKEKK